MPTDSCLVILHAHVMARHAVVGSAFSRVQVERASVRGVRVKKGCGSKSRKRQEENTEPTKASNDEAVPHTRTHNCQGVNELRCGAARIRQDLRRRSRVPEDVVTPDALLNGARRGHSPTPLWRRPTSPPGCPPRLPPRSATTPRRPLEANRMRPQRATPDMCRAFAPGPQSAASFGVVCVKRQSNIGLSIFSSVPRRARPSLHRRLIGGSSVHPPSWRQQNDTTTTQWLRARAFQCGSHEAATVHGQDTHCTRALMQSFHLIIAPIRRRSSDAHAASAANKSGTLIQPDADNTHVAVVRTRLHVHCCRGAVNA